ncbi:MAG TPA: Gfo/Idh/MocA family oxidoreductase [bacterium]|nr:Gfo/Idh/MocA family oxidoreductase [bacterium]HPN42146.1 Gfo/Idh/MocA family oxidoreductase [bacterium]
MENIRVNFGVIGLGAIGPRHVDRIRQFKSAKLAGICDIKEHRLAKYDSGEFLKYTDYHDLLANENIDVISICTPNYLHAEMAVDALSARKHVVCEKPMGLTSKECKLMVHAALTNNKTLFVVKQNRYNPPIVAVKKLIDEGQLGKIFMIVVNCYWNRNKEYYAQSDWRGKKQLDGGALFTQFSHFVDLMLMFAGSVESIYAVGGNYHHPEIEIEDTGVLSIKFDNGIVGSLNFTNNSFDSNMEGSITIFAENGTVKIGGQYLNKLEYQNIAGDAIHVAESVNGPNDYGKYQGSMSNHDKVYENVIDSLTNGGKVAVSGIEGMWTTEVIEAAYKSMETGERIFI